VPDLYADIASIPAETQSILANANVIRAGDPAMAVIRRRLATKFAGEVSVPGGCREPPRDEAP